MRTGTKLVLTYFGGLLSGIVLTVIAAIFVASSATKETMPDDNLKMFEQPRQEIKAKEFSIMQVLPDGSALAITSAANGYYTFGTVVLFPADEEAAYYDNQIIEVPTGKRAMQVGIFRYSTRMDEYKTVPVVRIMDK